MVYLNACKEKVQKSKHSSLTMQQKIQLNNYFIIVGNHTTNLLLIEKLF